MDEGTGYEKKSMAIIFGREHRSEAWEYWTLEKHFRPVPLHKNTDFRRYVNWSLCRIIITGVVF